MFGVVKIYEVFYSKGTFASMEKLFVAFVLDPEVMGEMPDRTCLLNLKHLRH